GAASWRHLTPRPGALFVVGDPKQSIYRFRRADMMLYQQVKRRFESFGAVVELTSNFRSRKPIERFVNDVFERRFPQESTALQARFAPLSVQMPEDPAAGVLWYELDNPVHGRVPHLAKQDSERLATYISDRIAGGERRAGDFLVLTPTTKWLARYASALEARNIPVQVTGAGVGGPDNVELAELRLLLHALSDPGDPTLTLAVLVGLFFGLDYEQLVQHVEKWRPGIEREVRASFGFTRDWDDAATPVEHALRTLHGFWLLTRDHPADVAVQQIVDTLGALPFAAAGELGESRAGALLFVVEAVRATCVNGDSSLTGALAALDAALDEDESEAPLEPGRADVVRVMNLHKAKGLEAAVVVLAMPFGDWSPLPSSRVVRDETGRALGYAAVTTRKTRNTSVTLAQPADWDEHAAIEEQFRLAENDRLLYVAATRAADELIVACAYNGHSPSKWRSFHEWLVHNAARITLPQSRRAAREELETSADEMRARIARTDAARALHALPTYRAAAVTARKKVLSEGHRSSTADHDPDVQHSGTAAHAGGVAARGTDWGSAVHAALEAAARGADEDELALGCRNILTALERPVDETGEPRELAELLAVVASVRGSAVWQRSTRVERRLIEVPFAVCFSAAEYARIAWTAGSAVGPRTDAVAVADVAKVVELVEGRIDLLFREPGGWVLVDYKSDAAGSAVPLDLLQQYEAQLHLYAAAWERLTGEPVAERVLLFTATGEQITRSLPG
ncbi:MAG: PD-(D/E)XK nuclease family protein, partial [Gemmatimonadota bacterium]